MTRQVMLFLGVLIIVISTATPAADEQLDIDFLEWLGQRVEIEELGVDVDSWDSSEEQDSEKDVSAVKTQ